MEKRGVASVIAVMAGRAVLLLTASAGLGQTPQEQAWTVLRSAAADKTSEQRVTAMRVLSVVPGDPRSVELAEQALQDQTPDVRAAAAATLGLLKAESSAPKLKAALKDPDGQVVMSAASALVNMGNEFGYEVYFAVLTGQRKSGAGLVADQEQQLTRVLSNPKDLAATAFEQGIGYVPFGGLGYGAFKAIHDRGEKELIVRAAAARVLAKDADPRSANALVAATADKGWLVRAAAYESLAHRGDPSLLAEITRGLTDEQNVVKLAAAAAVAQLSSLPAK